VIGPEHKISALLQKRTWWSAFAAAESANILGIARSCSSVRHNGRRSLPCHGARIVLCMEG